MATVAQILKDSGFTDEQIAGMEPKAITAFTSVLTEADKQRAEAKAARDAAELAKRSNIDFYDTQIAPSLVAWEEEKQRIENERATAAAQAAFYRTQNEQARASGFIPADAPGYQQSRDNQGRYVSGAPGSTPGSPTFNVNEFAAKAGAGLAQISDIDWKYRSLFDGKPMPVSPSELIRQADARRLDPMTYANQAFGFDKREQELAQQRQEAHDSAIAAKAVAENDRKWAERVGSNPDLRRPQENVKMSEVQRGVKAGNIPDPLMLNDQQRRAQTAQMIRKELAES